MYKNDHSEDTNQINGKHRYHDLCPIRIDVTNLPRIYATPVQISAGVYGPVEDIVLNIGDRDNRYDAAYA
jgi:hypothetical protein